MSKSQKAVVSASDLPVGHFRELDLSFAGGSQERAGAQEGGAVPVSCGQIFDDAGMAKDVLTGEE